MAITIVVLFIITMEMVTLVLKMATKVILIEAII